MYLADLDHRGIGNAIRKMKPSIMVMGYSPMYSTAVALENEFLNEIIAQPRPNLEDFIVEVRNAVENTNQQLSRMQVGLK